jgi:hypothetical protein
MSNEERPPNSEEEPDAPEELSQDPFVERLRPDPAQPPTPVRVLEGLMGKSDREEYWRLYFTRELNSYVEFRAEDVVYSEPIPSDQPPFVGLDATRVGIQRDATIEFTRTRMPRPVDEFDLDIRLGAPGRERALPLPRTGGCDAIRFQTELDGCGAFHTEVTCPPWQTCDTCRTGCGQFTCETCQTQCDQATCQTCQTQCGQHTCAPTCQTCNTCDCPTGPFPPTCGLRCPRQ